jgi:microcystin-dependent protein
MLITNSLLTSNRITAQNIYGKLNGIANSTEMSSNSPELIGPSSIVPVGTISCGTITNINTINVGIGTVNASTFIGSNMSITSLQPINGDIVGTTTGTIYTTSSIIYGSNIPINQYLMINSNLSIRNQTGPSSSLNVYQSGSGSSYPVADFYDGDISTVVPALRIADGGNIGLGTTIPIAKLHVQGTGYFSTSIGIGTTLPIYPLHVEGGNVCFSSNIGIGIKTPLANLHVDGEIIIPELTGMVLHFATSNAPIGWLKCNGARVNRASYSNLFARIGTTYGVGDGSTTFGIPDLRGVFIRGWLDDNRTVRITNYDPDRSIDFNSTIQTDDFKAHTHSYVDRGDTRTDGRNPGGPTVADDTSRTDTTGSTGGTETRPFNMALLACIKY